VRWKGLEKKLNNKRTSGIEDIKQAEEQTGVKDKEGGD